MNSQEFATIASILKKAYGSDKVMPDQDAINVWYGFLKDIDYRTMKVAVSEHIATNRFAPSISELRELASGVLSEQIVPWDMAWGNVLRAVRKYGTYQETEAMESLDGITAAIVRRMGFKNICLSENIEVERANFRMAYEAEAKSRKRGSMVPLSVQGEKRAILDSRINTAAVRIGFKEDKQNEDND